MASYKTPKPVAFKVPKAPALKLPKPPRIAGPPAAKFKSAPVGRHAAMPSLSMLARRGLTPRVALAKAAAGASYTSSKRNPDYPTP